MFWYCLTCKKIQTIRVHAKIQAQAWSVVRVLERHQEAGAWCTCSVQNRIYDMIKRGSLQTKSVKLLILDESNEMLSNGFEKPHLRCLQIRCSDLFYFCYFPQKILELTNKFIMDPERKLVKRDELTLEVSGSFA